MAGLFVFGEFWGLETAHGGLILRWLVQPG
jgi:hypothetical protein